MNIEHTCFGFVGLGLIGGSIAKTIRRICPASRIVAYNRTPSVLELAVAEGIVDVACDRVDERFSACDYIFLCMPVSFNVAYLPVLAGLIKDGCIITDVGSVKTDIHKHVTDAGLEKCFIGGHPMAGSDKTGYEHASDYLIENAYYIITPTAQVPKEAVDNYYQLVKELGAIPMILDYQEHDYAAAAVSHVPHIIAYSLVHLVMQSDNPQQTMRHIAAGGFKDMTRIASSSPTMWQHICMTNSENVCQVLDDFIDILQHAREKIVTHKETELYDFFDEAMQYRSNLSSSKGLVPSVYELYCDIHDEAGAIATLATSLAVNNISIKNIGIVHNREFENGVLHIEFYDNEALSNAIGLLKKKHYNIYTSNISKQTGN